MALNIKNVEVERLAAEVARMTRETKTEAIRRALEERKKRLKLNGAHAGGRAAQIKAYLEREVWPHIPPNVRGKKFSKQEQEEILGIGPDGYPE
jgi:antitoxin VapB